MKRIRKSQSTLYIINCRNLLKTFGDSFHIKEFIYQTFSSLEFFFIHWVTQKLPKIYTETQWHLFRHTDLQTRRNTDKHTNRYTNTKTQNHNETQTNRHKHIKTHRGTQSGIWHTYSDTHTGWPRSYRKYILQIMQPSQYENAKLQYRFAVTSGSPSRYTTTIRNKKTQSHKDTQT